MDFPTTMPGPGDESTWGHIKPGDPRYDDRADDAECKAKLLRLVSDRIWLAELFEGIDDHVALVDAVMDDDMPKIGRIFLEYIHREVGRS